MEFGVLWGDRAWSDSDDEVGDDDYEEGYLIQNWKEKYQEDQLEKSLFEKKVPPHIKPDFVPKLPIVKCAKEDSDDLGGHALGKGETITQGPPCSLPYLHPSSWLHSVCLWGRQVGGVYPALRSRQDLLQGF